MVRTIHILLLILSLIACPLRCLGMPMLPDADGAERSGCACCRSGHCSPTQNENVATGQAEPAAPNSPQPKASSEQEYPSPGTPAGDRPTVPRDSHLPLSPAEDGCQCSNCLCEGAILTNDDSARAVDVSDDLCVAWLRPVAWMATSDPVWVKSNPPPEPVLHSGRTLRLALESLLL
jgi:hypothetical protein